MTDITVTTKSSFPEKRSWLLSPHGTEPGTTPSVTLDITKFTAADHYPNGFIPSGIVLGIVTATGLAAPYDNAATDGTQTAVGILFGSLPVHTGSTKVSGARLVHGFVSRSKLPIAAGKTGSLDSAGEVDLSHIIFSA